MPPFDPIASPTVRAADHLEPAFVHADQVEAAKRKLSDHRARRKKLPNLLIFMMDDVGWGDFGCYGGGVAVGAPTGNVSVITTLVANDGPPLFTVIDVSAAGVVEGITVVIARPSNAESSGSSAA